MPYNDSGGGGGTKLSRWVRKWKELDDLIKSVVGPHDSEPLKSRVEKWRAERREWADLVTDAVDKRPGLWHDAVNSGFNEELLTERVGIDPAGPPVPEGNGGGDGGGDGHECPDGFKWSEKQQKCLKIKPPPGPGTGTTKQAQDNRLLGDFGKQFDLVKSRKGIYTARYIYTIDGRRFEAGVRLGRGEDVLAKYGLKASDAKHLTKEQMKRIKNIGDADDLAPNMKKGDKSVFDALERHLNLQYEGQSILKFEGVMAAIIKKSMFGLNAAEFENQLRNTGWYGKTEPYQREWQTVTSARTKKNVISRTLETVVDSLEDLYGLEWASTVKGGMKTAREMATKIASGQWGLPGDGMQFWLDRQADKAGAIEGTPEWLRRQAEQEQINAQLNRPEDKLEELRASAMNYLGQVHGTPLIDRSTLKQWANDLVTGTASDSDWQKFLRQQMKNLHPYFDENQSYTSQASSYKSVGESLTGTPWTWDDPYLKKIAGTDADGKLNGTATSLYDYEQYIRDNDPRFWENPATESKGLGFLSELNFRMTGTR